MADHSLDPSTNNLSLQIDSETWLCKRRYDVAALYLCRTSCLSSLDWCSTLPVQVAHMCMCVNKLGQYEFVAFSVPIHYWKQCWLTITKDWYENCCKTRVYFYMRNLLDVQCTPCPNQLIMIHYVVRDWWNIYDITQKINHHRKWLWINLLWVRRCPIYSYTER